MVPIQSCSPFSGSHRLVPVGRMITWHSLATFNNWEWPQYAPSSSQSSYINGYYIVHIHSYYMEAAPRRFLSRILLVESSASGVLLALF